MLVFWKQNLVFLAAPKTGTTALEGALAPHASLVIRHPPQIKHAPINGYRRFIKPLLSQAGKKKPELMTVLRHPVDWLSSWYRYRSREDLVGNPNSTSGLSFDEFVTEYCRDKPAQYAKVGSQSKYVLDGSGNRAVKYLFRYEDQPRLIDFLEDRLDCKINLERLNVSPVRDIVLSPEVEAKLREKRAKEFAVWDMAGG